MKNISKKLKKKAEKPLDIDSVVCDHPNEDWVYDESGVDMYCKKCDKLDNDNQK